MSSFLIFHPLRAIAVRKHVNSVKLVQVQTFLPLLPPLGLSFPSPGATGKGTPCRTVPGRRADRTQLGSAVDLRLPLPPP